MEHQKRKRNMAKSNGCALSALDAFIQAEAESAKPQQEGEFTLDEYRKKMAILGVTLNESTARRKMNKLIQDGVLTSRKSLLSGNTTFYRFL